ncbi:TPA: PD-(D/E)XK nuclease family transposase, partial [Candidatus Ventrenecus avicola]|nr:PD-(D/E)XK nuclease family transposase [Candidatus Ventrenecus avicola]
MNNQDASSKDFVFDPMNDAAFKSLIRAEETRDIVIGVLSDITPVLENELKNALFLGGEVPKEILKEKGMVSDVLVRVNDKNRIIIEANRQYSKNLFDKNASYAFKNSYMESNVGKSEYHPVSLVSVDKENVFHTDKPILVFQIQDEEGHIETELYYSVHLVLENFQNLAYTISDRVRNFMEFFQNQPDTIANLKEKYKDGEMMAFVNKAEELS